MFYVDSRSLTAMSFPFSSQVNEVLTNLSAAELYIVNSDAIRILIIQ